MSDPIALSSRIRGYLTELERVVTRTKLLAEKALTSGDDGYWDGVALNLHGFYCGTERIFEDIARTMDGSIPSGSEWHISILVQMSSAIVDRRPPVISSTLHQKLDEYRGFRHVVRNVYAFNFRPSRLNELVTELSNCFSLLKQELYSFADFLENLG